MLKHVSPEMKALGEGAIPYDGGLYPWEWIEDDKKIFDAFQGSLLVAPILQKLILNRDPEEVMAWVDTVTKWGFKRIIPCHFANNVKASPVDFRAAFESFLYEKETPTGKAIRIFKGAWNEPARPREEDVKFLSDVSKQLTEKGVLYPEAPLLNR